MGISRYNAEGYRALTPYEALSLTARKKKKKHKTRHPLVFICSPYAGDVTRNTRNARRYCLFAMEQGVAPFAPHLFYPQLLDDNDKEQRELGISLGLAWLRKCDALWYFGEKVTDGMGREIQAAKRHGLKVKHYNDELEETHHDR